VPLRGGSNSRIGGNGKERQHGACASFYADSLRNFAQGQGLSRVKSPILGTHLLAHRLPLPEVARRCRSNLLTIDEQERLTDEYKQGNRDATGTN